MTNLKWGKDVDEMIWAMYTAGMTHKQIFDRLREGRGPGQTEPSEIPFTTVGNRIRSLRKARGDRSDWIPADEEERYVNDTARAIRRRTLSLANKQLRKLEVKAREEDLGVNDLKRMAELQTLASRVAKELKEPVIKGEKPKRQPPDTSQGGLIERLAKEESGE